MAFSSRTAVLLGVLHCSLLPPASASEPPKVKVEFRRAEAKPAEGLSEARVAGTEEKVYLHKAAEITNADIAKAQPGLSASGDFEVLVGFTKSGAEKMAKLYKSHKGRPLAILVDGKVVCAPILADKITEHAVISGSFTRAEVERISRGISGK